MPRAPEPVQILYMIIPKSTPELWWAATEEDIKDAYAKHEFSPHDVVIRRYEFDWTMRGTKWLS